MNPTKIINAGSRQEEKNNDHEGHLEPMSNTLHVDSRTKNDKKNYTFFFPCPISIILVSNKYTMSGDALDHFELCRDELVVKDEGRKEGVGRVRVDASARARNVESVEEKRGASADLVGLLLPLVVRGRVLQDGPLGGELENVVDADALLLHAGRGHVNNLALAVVDGDPAARPGDPPEVVHLLAEGNNHLLGVGRVPKLFNFIIYRKGSTDLTCV